MEKLFCAFNNYYKDNGNAWIVAKNIIIR